MSKRIEGRRRGEVTFFFLASGEHFASSKGDNTTEATEMTAIRVSGNGLALTNSGYHAFLLFALLSLSFCF